jgi:hypothetical protein
MYISDYFCLEDFVEWKMKLQECQHHHQQQQQQQQEQQLDENQDTNAAHFLRSVANQTLVGYDNTSSYNNETETCIPINGTFLDNQTTSNNTAPNQNYINSTRPITILALRGRCSFESKAQMAMLLNEIFTAHGKSNRIAHIIVYNNLTGHSEEDEELIDMGLASQTFQEYASQSEHEDRYKVGMVYVNSNSGQDLIHRMVERGRDVALLPYLNVNGLFEYDANTTGDFTDANERALYEAGADGVEESNKGEYNNTISNDKELVHDASITNGWFFPATLTKFCLSCGSERNYGFDPPVLDVTQPPKGWGQGWYSGGWGSHDNTYHPGERPIFGDNSEGPIIYDRYKGNYYYPQEWVEAVRKLMISVLAVLLIGPFVFAAWRWRSVGGTVRLARDENGARHLRLIAPDMEAFVNGQNNSVERNGTKLDRAQVFALPEMEYVGHPEEGAADEYVESGVRDEATSDQNTENNMISPAQDAPSHAALAQSPPTPSSSLGECLEAGVFVSSTCCSICIEEFEHGEKLRILPRCSHAFHTGESHHDPILLHLAHI